MTTRPDPRSGLPANPQVRVDPQSSRRWTVIPILERVKPNSSYFFELAQHYCADRTRGGPGDVTPPAGARWLCVSLRWPDSFSRPFMLLQFHSTLLSAFIGVVVCVSTSAQVNPLMDVIKPQSIQQYGDGHTGRWSVGCYIWYSDEGPGRAAPPMQSPPAVPLPNNNNNLTHFCFVISVQFCFVAQQLGRPLGTLASPFFLNFFNFFLLSFLSASLYFSKRGAYWDRLCRDVVGWLSRACTVAKRCILGL